MHWQAARLILGMLTVFGSLVGVVASSWRVYRSCDPDNVFDGAPIDAVAGTVEPRGWPFFGCEATYVLGSGDIEGRAAPFDFSCVFLAVLVLGVVTVVHAARWRPAPRGERQGRMARNADRGVHDQR